MNPVISVGCGLSDEGTGDYDFKVLRPTGPMVQAAFGICHQVARLVEDALPGLKVVKARFYHNRYHRKPGVSTPINLPGVISLEVAVVWAEFESKGEIEAKVDTHELEFADGWLLKPGRVMSVEFETFVEANVEVVLKAIRTAAEVRQSVLSGRDKAIGRAISKIQFR